MAIEHKSKVDFGRLQSIQLSEWNFRDLSRVSYEARGVFRIISFEAFLKLSFNGISIEDRVLRVRSHIPWIPFFINTIFPSMNIFIFYTMKMQNINSKTFFFYS